MVHIPKQRFFSRAIQISNLNAEDNFIFLFSETRLFRLNIIEQHNIQQRQNPTSFGMGHVSLSASASRDLLLLVRHQGTVTLLCHAQLKLVNKFGNLNSIKLKMVFYHFFDRQIYKRSLC